MKDIRILNVGEMSIKRKNAKHKQLHFWFLKQRRKLV